MWKSWDKHDHTKYPVISCSVHHSGISSTLECYLVVRTWTEKGGSAFRHRHPHPASFHITTYLRSPSSTIRSFFSFPAPRRTSRWCYLPGISLAWRFPPLLFLLFSVVLHIFVHGLQSYTCTYVVHISLVSCSFRFSSSKSIPFSLRLWFRQQRHSASVSPTQPRTLISCGAGLLSICAGCTCVVGAENNALRLHTSVASCLYFHSLLERWASVRSFEKGFWLDTQHCFRTADVCIFGKLWATGNTIVWVVLFRQSINLIC